MQNNETAKTRWVHKHWRRIVVGIIVLILTLAAEWIWWLRTHDDGPQLRAGNYSYNLEIADTEAARAQGLSNRTALPQNAGMLFKFTESAVQCFWMKDMQFPLDMVWLDTDKRVQQVKPDISPGSYPKSFCYKGSSQYVLELNAGEAAKAGIKTGQVLHF